MPNPDHINPQDKLAQAKDREEVFQKFLAMAMETGANPENPALVYQGLQNSPYQSQISDYPNRLKTKPEDPNALYKNYPRVGELPEIEQKGLEFLHPDIENACVCLGKFIEGKMKGRWLGRNALTKAQFWSGTKIIPLINTACQMNKDFPDSDIDNCIIRDPANPEHTIPFSEVASDIISYQQRIASSNALAAMCKRFETFEGLERWLKKTTGNNQLEFRGMYGEPPFINRPELFDRKKQKIVLISAPESKQGENLVTAYDLARFISMLGWHQHLPQESRFPGANWHSLESIIKAMGEDPCRYAEIAIATLGLADAIASPVIISKLGNGFSDLRISTEIVYVALVQFLDLRPQANGEAPVLRSASMALRGVKPLQEKQQDALELDARMAAEVTEILRRTVTGELERGTGNRE